MYGSGSGCVELPWHLHVLRPPSAPGGTAGTCTWLSPFHASELKTRLFTLYASGYMAQAQAPILARIDQLKMMIRCAILITFGRARFVVACALKD